jgi:hypothetical protein
MMIEMRHRSGAPDRGDGFLRSTRGRRFARLVDDGVERLERRENVLAMMVEVDEGVAADVRWRRVK